MIVHTNNQVRGVIDINRQIPFLITVSYLFFFVFIRLAVTVAGSAQGLSTDKFFYIGRNIIIFGYHIHHFYIGIILISYAAWMAIVHTEKMDRKLMAVVFGAGLGLFMDEVGMLLTGSYHNQLTFWLSMLLAVMLLNVIFFPYFWAEARKNIKSSSSAVAKFMVKHDHFIKVADYVSEKTGRTERLSLILTGLIFLSIGVLILFYPQFVHYWVAGGFFIQGVSSFIRAWYSEEARKAQETGG